MFFTQLLQLSLRFWFEFYLCVTVMALWQSKLPLGKNKVSTGWIDGVVRSRPVPSHCVLCGSVVFTLARCEWDWGGGGDWEMLGLRTRRTSRFCEDQSSDAVVSAIPCCFMASHLFLVSHFESVPNTLEAFLHCVIVSCSVLPRFVRHNI